MNATFLLMAANIAAAGTLIGLAGLVVERFLRTRTGAFAGQAPVRYAVLLAALGLVLATPALVIGAHVWSLGMVRIDEADLAQVFGERTESAPASSPVAWDVPSPAADARRETAPPLPTTPPAQAAPWTIRMGEGLLAFWLGGAVFSLGRLAMGLIAVTRLRQAFEPPSAAALEAARRAAELLGLARVPRVAMARSIPAPLAVGLFRPTIALPPTVDDLDDKALDAVMLHEIGHLMRGDLWTALFERIATALFWWSPPIHRLSARLCDLREDLCDNYVLEQQGDGRSLAGLLVELAEQAIDAPRFPAAIGLFEDEPVGLAARIERLLAKDRDLMTRATFTQQAMTAALGLAVLSSVVLSTVRAAPPTSEAAVEIALAPNEPAKELPPPAVELKLSITPERWVKGKPVKLQLQAKNHSHESLQIAWGQTDVGVAFEIYDAKGKAIEKQIGHALRALPTREQVAELYPILKPGEMRTLDLSADWGNRPGVLWVNFMMGHCAWNLQEGGAYTMRAVLNQKDLRQEGGSEHQDEKLWWKGATTSPGVALNLAPAQEGGEIREPNDAEKNGLSVSVKLGQAQFVEEKPLDFVATFKNVSQADFRFLPSPKNYLGWKFHFRNVDSGTQWLAENTAKREGFTGEPETLKAGESLEVPVKVDHGFLFQHVGAKDGRLPNRRDLPPGRYQMTIEVVGHGATAQRELEKQPPYWVGELKTKPTTFTVHKKDAKEGG